MNDDISIQVTAASSEDASMIASFIGQSMTEAGFNNVSVDQSILDSGGGSYLDLIREVNPVLFEANVNIGYDGYGSVVPADD